MATVFHPFALHNAPKVVASLAKAFPHVRSICDVGCGSGAFAAEFLRRGYRIVGCERSKKGIALTRSQGVECLSFDLRLQPAAPLHGPFDLVYCFEVGEHVAPPLDTNLVSFLSGLGRIVVFSAAPPGQGGIGHINEQPPEYWAAQFSDAGLQIAEDETQTIREELRNSGADFWFWRNTTIFRTATEAKQA